MSSCTLLSIAAPPLTYVAGTVMMMLVLWVVFRFLELAQLDASQEDDSVVLQYQVQGSYDSELLQLQDSFQGKIVHLLSDTVRQSFVKDG